MLFQIKILSYCETNQVPGPTRSHSPESPVQCSFYAGCGSSLLSLHLSLLVSRKVASKPVTVTKVIKEFSRMNLFKPKEFSLAARYSMLQIFLMLDWEDLNQIAVFAKWNSIISVLYEDEPGEGDPGQQR